MSTSQNRGKATTLLGKANVAYCVDATVEAVQPTGRRCPHDRVARIAQRPGQLTDRDDAMLAICQRCECCI